MYQKLFKCSTRPTVHHIRGHFDHFYMIASLKNHFFRSKQCTYVDITTLQTGIFKKNQERCGQHGAFERTTRNIKHRATSYIGTQKNT